MTLLLPSWYAEKGGEQVTEKNSAVKCKWVCTVGESHNRNRFYVARKEKGVRGKGGGVNPQSQGRG